MKAEPIAQDLADAIVAKDRWRAQEQNYNRRIQELQEELATALRITETPEIAVPGFQFHLCGSSGIDILRTNG